MEDEITLLQELNTSFSRKEYLNTLFLYKKRDILSLYSCILFNLFSFILACFIILLATTGLLNNITLFLGYEFYTVVLLLAPFVCITLIMNTNLWECILSIKKIYVLKKILKNPFIKKNGHMLKNRTKLLQKLHFNMDFECYQIKMGIMGEYKENISFYDALELLICKNNYCCIEYQPSKIILTINEFERIY